MRVITFSQDNNKVYIYQKCCIDVLSITIYYIIKEIYRNFKKEID